MDLSVTKATPELKALVEEARRRTGIEAAVDADSEPYKFLISHLIRSLSEEVVDPNSRARGGDETVWASGHADKLSINHVLRTAHASLVSVGHAALANGQLLDTIRRLDAFGPFLAPLDIRQESDRHAEAVAALAACARIPNAEGFTTDWSESEK